MGSSCVADARARAAPDQRLPRCCRIVRSKTFSEVFERGRRLHGRYFVIWVLASNGLGVSRVGVVASKRTFRRAVDRARAKRLLRESFRLNRFRLSPLSDVVMVGRRAILGASRQDVEKELLRLLSAARVLGSAA